MINEFLYALFLVFLILYLGVIIIVSMIFSIRAYQTRLKNLMYGGICFVLVVVSRVGGLLLNFNILLESIFFTLHYIFAVFFVKSIFYKDRKSPYLSILLITIIGSVFLNSVIFFEMNQNLPLLHYLHISLDFFIRFVIFIWLANASLSAYKEFRNEDIEPWIKTRYKLTAIVSLLVSLYNINSFFLPWNVSSGDPDNIISFIVFGIMSIVALIISIGFFLAWITPNWYKHYLNRGYEPLEDKRYTEEEIIEIVKYLADKLAKKTNLSVPATRGALKLSIKDEMGPFKPLNQLSYGDLKKIIKNSLKKRLKDLNTQNVEIIVEDMLKQLIIGQSLIMMSNF